MFGGYYNFYQFVDASYGQTNYSVIKAIIN